MDSSTGIDNILRKMKIVFPDTDPKKYNYSPQKGVYPSNINMYTDFIHSRAKVFFEIVDRFNLEYAVFAGSSVGMVRNNRNLPWVDDYDMIILKESIEKFEKEIISVLKKNDFDCFRPGGDIRDGGFHILSKKKFLGEKYFQIDVFYSYFDDKDIIRNTGYWGRYHQCRKLTRDVVLPFRRMKFHDDLIIPFMNNVDEEVRLTYGDVFNECVISSHSMKETITYDNWKSCVEDFDNVVKTSINNTRENIYKNEFYTPKNKLNIMKNDTFFTDEIQLLTYISENNIGEIYIFDHGFLYRFPATIRYYYPNIRMEFFAYGENPGTLPYVNYIDVVNVRNDDILNFYNDLDIVYVKKPEIKKIKLITFGTFDMFHIGHENLLKKCADYSDQIVVGLSTDEFTFKKKGIYPDESYEIRKQHISKQHVVVEVFPEESMEMKKDYITSHGSNIFVMGDDWKGKFDWIDHCVIYLPRTPGISSTELRNQKKVTKIK